MEGHVIISNQIRVTPHGPRYSRNEYEEEHVSDEIRTVSDKVHLNPHRMHNASRNHMKTQEGISLG